MTKFDGGLTWEILYSKCYGYYSDLCCDGVITEEQAEREWDKLQLMDKGQLQRKWKGIKNPSQSDTGIKN